MIGSFWNLCRACPSMPVDKLHSEYRSTYRWHEYTGPRQEVVRKAPQPSGRPSTAPCPTVNPTNKNQASEVNEVPRFEPALPRRKKRPELAYRTHEFLGMAEIIGSDDSIDTSVTLDRARMITSNQPTVTIPERNSNPRGGTEYRVQFAWPRSRGRAKISSNGVPRKSLSMGAIRPVGVHRNDKVVTEVEQDAAPEPDELWGEEKIRDEIVSKEEKSRRRKEFKTEYKKKFRPFSQYDYVEGKFQKKKEIDEAPLSLLLTGGTPSDSWYREVLELRKKAGEYKHRGWGTELVPQHIAELYNKQMTLWEQVSRRSSLSALSLASTTPRSITKEEKEKENNKKSSPTKPHRPSTARPSTTRDKTVDKKKTLDEKDGKKDSPRPRKDQLMRHHLERTTGSVDGVLLPSPTREKLEPVIPQQKQEEQTKSPQKATPKSSPQSARSRSLGPAANVERRSPKRQPRTTSVAPSTQEPIAQTVPMTERNPRPTSLSTTAPYRPKSKAEDGKSHQVTKPKSMPNKQAVGVHGANIGDDSTKVGDTKPSGEVNADLSTLVKSPPEPTRVKSPEQILMRSPEPVNWTVPLDTGKTFTVTQNVRTGESMNRPHSEVKAWTPPGVPPPAPQSAPPQLPQQSQEWKSSNNDLPCNSFVGVNGLEEKSEDDVKNSTPPKSSSPILESNVAGTTLRCLDDPGPVSSSYQPTSYQGPYRVLEAPTTEPPPLIPRSAATDALEKARNRFDNFWGSGKGKNDNEGKV